MDFVTKRKRVQKKRNKKDTQKDQTSTRRLHKALFDEKQNGMKQMWKHLGVLLNPKRCKGPLK